MNRRVAAALLALVLAGAACSSGGDDDATPDDLPPTTLTTTPIAPTGAADTVRRWVDAVAGEDDAAALAFLAPGSQAVAGGPEGYGAARRDLREEWAAWAGTPSTFDAVPVADGVAAVIVHADGEEGGYRAAAVPVRVDATGDAWLVDPLQSTGEYRAVPEPGATVESEPELAVVLETGVELQVFVDGQAAVRQPAVPAGDGEDRVVYAPERPLGLGWHVVTFVFRRGDAVTARATPYLVEEI